MIEDCQKSLLLVCANDGFDVDSHRGISLYNAPLLKKGSCATTTGAVLVFQEVD